LIETEVREVRVPVLVPLPSNLTAFCFIPAFPEVYTVGAANKLMLQLYSAIYLCDEQVTAIRELQPKPVDITVELE